jgi:hypothetical protein
LEVGAEGVFKLDLRQDRDPGKQKLKGAVGTKTHWHHYCKHNHVGKQYGGFSKTEHRISVLKISILPKDVSRFYIGFVNTLISCFTK